MTIAIGVLCRRPPRVILAADSQWTNIMDGTVSFASKISVVRFGCSEVIVAQAGNPTFGKRVIEIVERDSKAKEILEARVVIDAFENAVREMRAQLDAYQAKIFEDPYNQSMLMFGFMEDDEPKLYILDITGHGISKGPDPGHHFAICGGGHSLAEYLLDEWADEKQPEETAIAIAIAVIQKVKKHQPGMCGGETNVRMVGPSGASISGVSVGKSLRLTQEVVNRTEKAIIKRLNHSQKKPLLQAKRDMGKIAQEFWKQYLARIEKEEKALGKKYNLAVDNPNP